MDSARVVSSAASTATCASSNPLASTNCLCLATSMPNCRYSSFAAQRFFLYGVSSGTVLSSRASQTAFYWKSFFSSIFLYFFFFPCWSLPPFFLLAVSSIFTLALEQKRGTQRAQVRIEKEKEKKVTGTRPRPIVYHLSFRSLVLLRENRDSLCFAGSGCVFGIDQLYCISANICHNVSN